MIISLDIETSGLRPNIHVPLSIGACTLEPEKENNRFEKRIFWSEYTLSTKAYTINRLTPHTNDGQTWPYVQNEFVKWLKQQCDDLQRIQFLGFNVGSFDLTFIKNRWLGKWFFGYRSIDLNSIVAFIEDHLNFMEINFVKGATDMTNQVTVIGGKHTALWDAIYSVMYWRSCHDAITNYYGGRTS